MSRSRIPVPCRVALGTCLLLLAQFLVAADDPAELEKKLAGAAGAERVELLLKLADAQVLRSPDQTVKRAQEAFEAANALSLPALAARAVSARGTGLFQLGDLDKARESFQEALKAGEALGDASLMGAGLNGVALVHLKRGQLDEALGLFRKAMAYQEKAGRKDKVAGITNNIAVIYYSKGQYDQALEFMSRAMKLYEEIGDERGQGVLSNALGNVHNKLGSTVRAREHFERALEIAKRTKHVTLQVSALVNIAEIHAKAREWDQALPRYEEALALARQVGSRDSIAVCLNNIGDVYREKGDAQKALANYQESMKISEEMNARPRLVVAHLNIGKLQLKAGQVGAAEANLVKAFRLADEVQERTLQKDAAESLVTLFGQKGDFRRAFEYQRALDGLKDQLFSKQNLEKVASLEAKLQAEQKERQIAVLKKQHEIQALEVKRQRLWIALVTTGLVFLAAVAVLLVKRNRLKERTNAELAAAYSRMEEQARSDALTNLANRRAATERLEQEVRRTERTRRPLSLLMLDVDDFKRINDERGHACGDAVLVGLGELLWSTLREVDLAARWGGEEFLLILPETSREGALQIAEKVRHAAEEIRVRDDGGEVSFTVTIGVATFKERLLVDECLRRADAALYEGKRAGKNRVVAAV